MSDQVPSLDLVWAATFGAAFARQVFDRMSEGKGPPDAGLAKGYAEEAEEVAKMAVEALQALGD